MRNTIQELSPDHFRSTMGDGMVNATQWAEPTVDIWPYVEALVKTGAVQNHVFENNLVESVYRNKFNTFDHVLLPTSELNYFVVIVVDLIQREITGYFLLDLSKEYGL
jgi:hypothetical protein